jgi:hypothetical protein
MKLLSFLQSSVVDPEQNLFWAGRIRIQKKIHSGSGFLKTALNKLAELPVVKFLVPDWGYS